MPNDKNDKGSDKAEKAAERSKMLEEQKKNLPPELPAKIEDWTRVLKDERTLNDLVEELHRKLVTNPTYRAFLRAVWDSQAIEGSLSADNWSAATMIREQAKKEGSEVADEKLATISQALGVVLRRYGASRKERRRTVGGEVVPPGNSDKDGSDKDGNGE